MKKGVALIFVFLLLPGVIAISTDMKSSYQPDETAIFRIQGNILEPIDFTDVKFLRNGHIEAPFDYDISRINGEYWVYAIMPFLDLGENETTEYTLVVENVATTEQGQNVEIDFESDFSVSGGVFAYTLSPGFISASDDFEIEVTLNEDIDRLIEIDFPDERELTLKPGQNSILFDIEGVNGGFYEIKIGEYKVPVFLIKESVKRGLKFDPSGIDSIVLVDSEQSWKFKIINTGEDIDDFVFEYNRDVFETIDFPERLESGQVYLVEFDLKTQDAIDEEIYLDYGDERIVLPVKISYTEDEEEVVLVDEEESEFTCLELNGNMCSNEEACSGSTVLSSDGDCCLGQCTQEDSGGSLAWIGWLLGFVLVIALAFIGIKYFRSGKQKDEFKRRVKNAERPIPIF